MPYISGLIEENSSLMKNGLIIIIVILLIILLLILIRHFKIPRKQQRIPKKKGDSHLDRIEKLRFLNEEPKEKLLLFDSIVIAYLAGIIKINKKEGYEKISKKLRERGYSELADFCNEVEYYMYGHTEVKEKDITNLINKFESLVSFRIMNLSDNKRERIQKNVEKRGRVGKNSDKSLINRFLKKPFVNKENYNKNKEIQRLRKLWYPDKGLNGKTS